MMKLKFHNQRHIQSRNRLIEIGFKRVLPKQYVLIRMIHRNLKKMTDSTATLKNSF
jgi:hypothetical protein